MVIPEGLAVIDLQGARLGPPEYDLASLLLDPYAALTAERRQQLLELYLRLTGAGAETTLHRYRCSGINRMLQALGAFAYLGQKLGKPGFLEHAPTARQHLEELSREGFPRLYNLSRRMETPLSTRARDPERTE
jgi:hypothetical protein